MKTNRTASGYLFKFNEPTENGRIYLKEAFDPQQFEELKLRGIIKQYHIDENGVKVIIGVDVISFDF